MGELNGLKQKKVVYFNSNEYHGETFISQEAVEAGYQNRNIRKSADMFEKGISTVLVRDDDSILVSAETNLLNILVLYSSARNAVTSMLETSGTDGTIEWSTPEREWLFSRLQFIAGD